MKNNHTSNSRSIPSAVTHNAHGHRISVIFSTAVACLVTLFSTSVAQEGPTKQNPPVKAVGIVVKKKPANGASRVTTNTKGQQEFTVAEAGDYVITLTTLPTASARIELEGGSIKGVKVGLGKNPSELIIASAISDETGNVEFKGLAPGSYFIVVPKAPTKEAPSLPNRKVVPEAPKTEVVPAKS